ncbi:MAG: holo-[acyl-carrier-protein] synthase [Candidatus Marinimicrobia bacterium]|nr:holo-[acyl-carrier-protein] synthase [Candidatus Neomarinimicrobiota bacterium]|tara:strand:- start:969 stop:1316 length:348 start_codon:yes stop_codon:yes gene_type:complete
MLSIGTDIVKIDRIKALYKDSKFLNKVFSALEFEYCNSYKDPYIHLSGKYAAKEAVKKALLSAKIVKTISLIDIEVLNNKDKSPYIKLINVNNIKCNVSISHDGDYAIAFVIIEK